MKRKKERRKGKRKKKQQQQLNIYKLKNVIKPLLTTLNVANYGS